MHTLVNPTEYSAMQLNECECERGQIESGLGVSNKRKITVLFITIKQNEIL